MREQGGFALGNVGRPGRALVVTLAALAVSGLVGGILVNWGPAGAGVVLFRWLAFDPQAPDTVWPVWPVWGAWRVWTLFTSGLLTSPSSYSHVLWSMVALYFFVPDLERRWGPWGVTRFLLAAVALGNLAALVAAHVPPLSMLAPARTFGPAAACTACVTTWTRQHRDAEIRLFFVLPVSGRILFWITLGFALLAVVFVEATPEGPLAPLSGVGAALLFGRSPGPLRAAWLRLRLAWLRRRGGDITVESILRGDRPRSTKRSGEPRPLRIVYGGLEEDLKKRKPPKDKRFMN